MSSFSVKPNVFIQSRKKDNIIKPTQQDLTSNIKHANDPNRLLKGFQGALNKYMKGMKDPTHKKEKANYWLEWAQQKEKEQFDLYMPGKIGKIDFKMSAQERIVYLEANPSQQKLEELKKSGGQFIDNQFPANQSSLNGTYPPNSLWKDVTWGRISEKLSDFDVFKTKIEPNDIKQGLLGDCYFLAGIAALAEVPERIKELFLITEKNEQKYYSVKLLYKGKWRIVNIDEMIPFVTDSKPAFSDSVNNQLWVILLEKAWAKLYKSYKQIESGFPEEVLHDLTGAPVKRIYLHSKGLKLDKLWQYLLYASDNTFSMVSCSVPGSDTESSQAGIIQGHAYTFLSAKQFKLGEKTQRVVQLRNPWGEVEWNGRWADDDSTWNYISKDVVKELGIGQRNKEDGVFFMPFEDYLNQFRDMYIAEINDKASYVYESFHDPKCEGVFFSIIIVHQGFYCFQIDNTPERAFTGKKQEQYRYPKSHFEMKKFEDDKVIDFKGTESNKRTLCQEYRLQPGKYVVYAKIDFDKKFQTKFSVTLAVYAEFCCGIYIASHEDAKKYTGDPNQKWVGQFEKYIFGPILRTKLQNPDKWVFDYSKIDGTTNNKNIAEKDQKQKQQHERKREEQIQRQRERQEFERLKDQELRRQRQLEEIQRMKESERKREEQRKRAQEKTRDEERKRQKQLQWEKRKEEERGRMVQEQQRKKRDENMKKKKRTETQILEEEEKRRLQELKELQEEKRRRKKQQEKGHSDFSSLKQTFKSDWESSKWSKRQQNNMDHKFNDHFSFNDQSRKRDQNFKVKPKKKMVVKETFKKTVTQVESMSGGEIKTQELEKEEKKTTNHYGSRPNVKKKTLIDRNERETRQSHLKGDEEPLYRYERILKQLEEQIENDKGQVKRKLQTDENITEARADDEDDGIQGFLEWEGLKRNTSKEEDQGHESKEQTDIKQKPKTPNSMQNSQFRR